MRILIDGYNLMHAIGFHGNLAQPGILEAARLRTLDKLAEYLSAEESSNTVVIFDAGHRGKEQPRHYARNSIRVEFAMDYANADSMIQELIRDHNTPKQLLVVSSDHQIQRTAKARKANFIDSDEWIVLLESRTKSKIKSNKTNSNSRQPPKTDTENDYWMEVFTADSIDEMINDGESDPTDEVEEDPFSGSDLDIFPPGYGEDIV